MSDIGFYGIVSALTGVVMLVIAALGLLIEALLRWRRGRGRSERAPGVALLSPFVYGGLAAAILVVTEHGSADVRETMDVIAPVVAGMGLVVWIWLRLWLARRVPADTSRDTVGV